MPSEIPQPTSQQSLGDEIPKRSSPSQVPTSILIVVGSRIRRAFPLSCAIEDSDMPAQQSLHAAAPARANARPYPRTCELTMLALFLGLAFVSHAARAATPGSGTVSPGNPSVSWTGSITGAGSGENTCVNGVSCDSFMVVLAPGDYTDKQLDVRITWTVPAYDYDLYVHVGTLTGPLLPASAGPPPSTSELVHIGIDPPVVTSPRVWWAHIQAATVPPLQSYNGNASLVALPPRPEITYLAGTLGFSHTIPLIARGTVRTLEPSIRVDVRGNCYVSGIRGVPAGVDLWRFDLNPGSPTFDPEMRNPVYLGQPDVFQQQGAEDETAGGADGGGDIDISTSFPTTPGGVPVLTMASLAAADISSNVSTNLGETFQHNGAVALIPSDDRQWIESDGPDNVYLFYRAPAPASGLFVQKSTDHGLTFGAAVPVLDTANPANTTPGYIDVDHADGTVYVSHQDNNALYVSHSVDGGQTWITRLVDSSTGHGHLFDPVKVGDDGTVYTVWSNERHILYAFSTDHGETWSLPGVIENPATTRTNVFPWLEAGSAGRLGVVWFGTEGDNISAAEWDVYYSQSLNANSAHPEFRQQRVSEHRIHGSNISEGGLGGSANRNLGDYFQVAYDPQGAAVIAFADDHNDFDGNTYVTRQLDGPGLLASANGGTGQVLPVSASGPPLYSFAEPEVLDPVHDAIVQTQPVPTDNPFDIVSIKYFADQNGPQAPYVGAKMTLSGLTAAPPAGSWRIAFTANAPDGDDQLPYGVSDHGDMFFVQASDSSGIPSFSYGTAYRDSTPLVPVIGAYAMAYHTIGAADSGLVDTTTSTVTVKVSLAKINALLPPGHPPLAAGRWLCGLRGSAATLGAGPKDNTRGGRFNFLIQYSGYVGVDPGAGPAKLSLSASPNPAPRGCTVRYTLPQRSSVSLDLFDVSGRYVRTLQSGPLDAGPHEAFWDGSGRGGAHVAPGVYFARLALADGKAINSRIVVVE